MKQIHMFPAASASAEPVIDNEKPSVALRDYQERIIRQAQAILDRGGNPLIVAAVGTGKTTVGAELARRLPGRILWLCHRVELIHQAAERLGLLTGERIGYELPGRFSAHERIVCASKDSLRTVRRLERIANYEDFRYVFCDETHHIPAPSYEAILAAYPKSQRIGLTATPGRLDKRPLKYFDSGTEPFDIVAASRDGWLVPIRARRVRVKEVDLSGVRTVAGDFDKAQLDALMRSEGAIHGVAKAILDYSGNRPVVSFVTSVGMANSQAEVINRYRPGAARVVTGKTPDNERKQLFFEFGRTYQVLVNVGIATEGVDLPRAAVVAMGRPTKSQSLFVQCLGRGLRPLPGVVDGPATAQERLEAIGASAKPHCLVLDFVGVTGRHSVAMGPDVFTDQESLRDDPGPIAAVKQRLDAGEELDLAGALAEEIAAEQDRQKKRQQRRERELAKRLAITGQVVLESEDVRLIGLGGDIAETEQSRSVLDGPPTPQQVSEFARLGLVYDGVVTARDARNRIMEARKELDFASPKMLALIQKHRPELYDPNMKRKRAGYIISQITRNWR